MKGWWLHNPINEKYFAILQVSAKFSYMFLVCIDEIVNKDQEVDFIIKEKGILTS
tara:strand:- start:839 stop:1003 length:165 start_codon:yes stop_codon:yes gene_type:complete